MLFSARLCRVPLFTIVTLLRQHIIQLGNYNFTALVESQQNDLHKCILNLFSPEGSVKGNLFHDSGSLRSERSSGPKSFETIFRKLAGRKLGQETEGTLARRPPFNG